jgi:hypothetical protein
MIGLPLEIRRRGGSGPVADAASDAERARVALLRFDNAFLLQGRVPDLRLLDDAADAIADPFWRGGPRHRRGDRPPSRRGIGPSRPLTSAPTIQCCPTGSVAAMSWIEWWPGRPPRPVIPARCGR